MQEFEYTYGIQYKEHKAKIKARNETHAAKRFRKKFNLPITLCACKFKIYDITPGKLLRNS